LTEAELFLFPQVRLIIRLSFVIRNYKWLKIHILEKSGDTYIPPSIS
jgi:hypothetical protein